MAGNYSKVTTVSTGGTILASDRNAEHDNHITNATPSGLDDYSTNATQMQSTTDPYPASAESLATSLAGELERLRYQFKTQLGLTQWYYDATTPYETFLTNVASYRRPRLVYVSATQVDVENNTGTANQTKILFPDGTSRSVTEDTSSAHKYRRFDITADAEFTSGTEDSGLRAALSEATDTWYAVYAVKSAINTANFVLVGDTTLPLQANFSTLNTAYGTSGWVYLGLIRNGDNSGATGNIVDFVQHGNITRFRNAASGNTVSMSGIRLATTAGATSITWTYAAGTGTVEIPNQVLMGWVSGGCGGASEVRLRNSGTTYDFIRMPAVSGGSNFGATLVYFNSDNLSVTGANSAKDLFLSGYVDNALSGGTNPIL